MDMSYQDIYVDLKVKMLKLKEQQANNAKYREKIWAYYEYLMIRGAPLLEAIKRAYYEISDTLQDVSDTPSNQTIKQNL